MVASFSNLANISFLYFSNNSFFKYVAHIIYFEKILLDTFEWRFAKPLWWIGDCITKKMLIRKIFGNVHHSVGRMFVCVMEWRNVKIKKYLTYSMDCSPTYKLVNSIEGCGKYTSHPFHHSDLLTCLIYNSFVVYSVYKIYFINFM